MLGYGGTNKKNDLNNNNNLMQSQIIEEDEDDDLQSLLIDPYWGKIHTSGAKAQCLRGFDGTAKAVPFQSNL